MADARGSAARPSDVPSASTDNIQDTLFTHAKAGMEGVDREKIKRLVHEYSKGSSFLAEQERRDAKVAERVAEQRRRLERLGDAEIAAAARRADSVLAKLDAERDLSRTWSCVDMDAFFAACEELDDPSLKGIPFAVGGVGMISTASYAARKYGVRSAMPGFIALKLCKQFDVTLKLVPGDHAKYTRYAEMARTAFAKFDPNFLPMSCDEAFVDLTDYCAQHGVDAAEAAARLRGAVHEATGGLTCSVGVAPSHAGEDRLRREQAQRAARASGGAHGARSLPRARSCASSPGSVVWPSGCFVRAWAPRRAASCWVGVGSSACSFRSARREAI